MKHYFLTIILLLFSFSAVSQFSAGFIGGINFSTVDLNYKNEEDEFEKKIKIRVNAGFIGEYQITESFFIRQEIKYSGKGVEINSQYEYDAPEGFYMGYEIDYLELPFNFVYHASDIELFAGPYLAFAINGNYAVEGDRVSDFYNLRFTDRLEVSPYGNSGYGDYVVSRTDAGFQLGMGVSIGDFIISGRISKGLLNLIPVIDSGGEVFKPDNRQTNRVISFNVIYLINRFKNE